MTATTAPALHEEEASFAGAGHRLVGTLTVPPGEGPFPAVLLLSGSGPIDRDSNHKKLRFDVSRQLAVALARAGVASYRFDKRGVGESSGDWRAAGLSDNVDDAAAALTLLRERPEVEPDRVFVAGHSEGAVQAVALAGRGLPIAGLVLLAGTARRGEEVLRWQARVIAPTLPRPVRLLLGLLRVDLEKRVASNHAKIKGTTADVTRMGLARVNAKWFREYLAYDPGRDLPTVHVPVLALTGAGDLQVDAADLPLIEQLVPGEVETHLVPGLTHTLRRQPGAPSLSRYKQELREPVDRFVLDTVTGWVRRHA
jgi:pimeloyl-ACP methyl ester carboxylesterase